jgi:hypothetical protein
VSTKNPATVTFTISSLSTATDVMGAELFEISGLSDTPMDQAASAAMSVGSTVTTPSITTSAPGELVITGIAFYTSSSTMTPASGWSVDQENGFFAAAAFRIGGPAGSTYGGSTMGTITAMTKPGTSTILSLKAR